MPIKPPRNSITENTSMRLAGNRQLDGSRRGSLSARNAFASESIINPSIGPDV